MAESRQTITPYLLYEDADAAIEFLVAAFGFREHDRMRDGEGRTLHAELSLGGGTVMLGAPGGDYGGPKRLGRATSLTYVYVDDVDAHHRRAEAAGAEITDEPADQPYGDRRYAAVDPEGQVWYFAQRIAADAP